MLSYREPSPREDYTIKERSWVRFARHKYPELVGETVFALFKQSGKWALAYGSLHGHIFHDEEDLVPVTSRRATYR